MNAPQTEIRLQEALALQRAAFLKDGMPDAATRADRLDRLIAMLLAFEKRIVDTLSADFGNRSPFSTRGGDIVGGIASIRHNRENLPLWMEPTRIPLPPAMEEAGARAEVIYQPLGVVGAIVPWNGPVLMAALAAAGIFAAGNRMMLKTPELTPQTSTLIAQMFGEYFDPAEVTVIEGGPDVAAAFTRLPFDHLLFTGSNTIARQVMKAAAENLVPVTLELGGKNPVIIGKGADLTLAAARIATGKMASSGQVCVSPDYVLVPAGQAPAFAEAVREQAQKLYPTLLGNNDYTSIISQRHVDRLRAMLEDARKNGGQVLEINPHGEEIWEHRARKFPLCLVLQPNDSMQVMQEEIFGPILPVLEYADFNEALGHIAGGDHPLSAYYFGTDATEETLAVQTIQCGNMVINDVRCQLFFEQLPFGGVGASGMGRYRGHEGFKTFSNAKTVVHQTKRDEALAAQRPPYSEAARATLQKHIDDLQVFARKP